MEKGFCKITNKNPPPSNVVLKRVLCNRQISVWMSKPDWMNKPPHRNKERRSVRGSNRLFFVVCSSRSVSDFGLSRGDLSYETKLIMSVGMYECAACEPGLSRTRYTRVRSRARRSLPSARSSPPSANFFRFATWGKSLEVVNSHVSP